MPDPFVRLSVSTLRHLGSDVVEIGFALGRDTLRFSDFTPGHYLTLRHHFSDGPVTRTYSLVSAPGEERLLILVKRVAGGRFSAFLNDDLRVGMTMDVAQPGGRFVLPESSKPERRLLALCAGIGITPIFAVMSHLLKTEPGARVTLLYGNRRRSGMIYDADLQALSQRWPERMRRFDLLTEPGEAEEPLFAGRLDGERLARLARAHNLLPADTVMICGPGTMAEDMSTALILLGVPRETILIERFGRASTRRPRPTRRGRRSGHVPLGADPDLLSQVEIRRNDTSVTIAVDQRESILGSARRQGLDLPHDCEAGICGTCRAFLARGDVEMASNYALDENARASGMILTCQSRPRAKQLVLDYDTPHEP